MFAIATNSLSNGETTTSPSYVSVRSLDHYGNAVQLGHAKEAAQRYGRSVVVAVVDVQDEKNSTEKMSSSSSFVMVVSLGKSPTLHPVRLPLETKDGDSHAPPLLGMCFTGVKGDANWLLQQLQKYSADVWERYDKGAMSAPNLAHVVARLLGRFAAQPEKHEWQSSLGLPGKQDRDDDRQSSWSRPLGVQTMIISLSSNSPKEKPSLSAQPLRLPGLLIIEPSGRILNPAARSKSGQVSLGAIGKACDKIQARLLRLFRGDRQGEPSVVDESSSSSSSSSSSTSRRHEGLSPSSWEHLPPTYDECQETLIRILLEETANGNDDVNSSQRGDAGGHVVMVESYSPDRGKIERRLFRYQNANAFAPI